jgi:tRNA 5-methylaminomethyl-2-thiouridine biosynthesis bifunctional protein
VKTTPIVPARIDFAQGTPRAPDFDDVYHPREGALDQARGVFLAGNGLPQRWQARARFTVLETGFGLGHNFLATWAAWRDDPQRCARLHYVALEKHPPSADDLGRALAPWPDTECARQLLRAWPPLTPGLHLLRFESQHVQLLLCLGDAHALARELVARVDAFFLDGFNPAHNATMWSADLFKSLARLAAPGATAATWSAARVVRDGLTAAGFEVQIARGPGMKRDITVARHAPRFTPPAPPGRALPAQAPRHALVIGAGIAGAAAARALSLQGVSCTVLEASPRAAQGASGNPAGLFHGTLGGDDTRYTRWYRAAAFVAAHWIRSVPGAGDASGLLRTQATRKLPAMHALLATQGLPPEYVVAVDAAQAGALAALPLPAPAWLFAQGGWAEAPALVHDALGLPGVQWHGRAPVHALQREGDAWHALDHAGRTIAAAPVVVLANAEDALRLCKLPTSWLRRVRGQVSTVSAADLLLPTGTPRLPVASGGYAIALPAERGGGLLIGATQQVGDDDEQPRDADHTHNLERAQQLLGQAVARDGAALGGRVAWRATTHDRLPLVGRAPDPQAVLPARRDAPRLLPRQPGLYLLSGLGSRGLTSAALAGELIAAQLTGAPWPLEADLVDAVDPARLLSGPAEPRSAAHAKSMRCTPSGVPSRHTRAR